MKYKFYRKTTVSHTPQNINSVFVIQVTSQPTVSLFLRLTYRMSHVVDLRLKWIKLEANPGQSALQLLLLFGVYKKKTFLRQTQLDACLSLANRNKNEKILLRDQVLL